MSFKVVEIGTNRNPVCDFLLVINSNWHHLVPFRSYRSLLFKFWTLCVLSHPLGGLGTTYDVHLELIGKRVVDFLLVLIELFSLSVTAESLRAKRDRKSAISLQRGNFDPKFHVKGVAFHQSFLPRCMQWRRGLAMGILSVRLSVRHTRGLWQNGGKICPDLYTIWKNI